MASAGDSLKPFQVNSLEFANNANMHPVSNEPPAGVTLLGILPETGNIYNTGLTVALPTSNPTGPEQLIMTDGDSIPRWQQGSSTDINAPVVLRNTSGEFHGILKGTADTAGSIRGGIGGQLVYQTGLSTTSFVTRPTAANKVLSYDITTNTPYFTTATLAGGSQGAIVVQTIKQGSELPVQEYESSYIDLGPDGSVLVSSGAEQLPVWVTTTNTGAPNSIMATDENGSFVANNITATLFGTADYSTSLTGGSPGTLVYQGDLDYSTFLAPPTDPNQVLTYDVANNQPSWSTGVASSQNLVGGASGSIPYQSAPGTTTFLGKPPTSNTMSLVSDSSGTPYWMNVSSSNLQTNSIVRRNEYGYFAANVITANIFSGVATSSNNIAGGTTGSIPYQSDVGVTSFTTGSANQVLTSGPAWVSYAPTNTPLTIVERDASGNFSAGTITASLTGTATTATNVDGGSTGAIPYQSSAGSTSFTVGSSNQVLTSTGGVSGPTWTSFDNNNISGALVKRDSGGNFVAGTITASLAGTATYASALSGGVTGAIPYQSSAGVTTFLNPGSSGYLLSSTGSTVQYVNPQTLTVNNTLGINVTPLASSDTDYYLGMVSGSGPAKQMLTDTGVTFNPLTQTLTVSNLVARLTYTNVINQTYIGGVNIVGGGAGQVPYQSAPGTTLFSATGTAGQVLTSGGTSAPTWTAATSINTNSAIVQRDSSGNFSAGTITASLSGTASQATNISGGAAGSLVYQTALNTTGTLAAGTSSYILRSTGTSSAPQWTAEAAGTGTNALSLGLVAGPSQQDSAIAIGNHAGTLTQAANTLAIGTYAGGQQSYGSIALGLNSGLVQQANSISIGTQSGFYQYPNSIAIGALAGGTQSQNQSSIAINATGTVLNTSNNSALYIKPVRSVGYASNVMGYTAEGEVVATPVTFINGSVAANMAGSSGYPVSNVAGMASGVASFLATPSSANFLSMMTDETGTGSVVFSNSPVLITPNLGTPSTLVGTNITGTAASFTAGTASSLTTSSAGAGTYYPVVAGAGGGGASQTARSNYNFSYQNAGGKGILRSNVYQIDESGGTNYWNVQSVSSTLTFTPPVATGSVSANLAASTGYLISNVTGLATGAATFLSSPSSANFLSMLTTETGSGNVVFSISPSLTTPDLGTPSALVGTNITGTAADFTANVALYTNVMANTTTNQVFNISSYPSGTGARQTYAGDILTFNPAATNNPNPAGGSVTHPQVKIGKTGSANGSLLLNGGTPYIHALNSNVYGIYMSNVAAANGWSPVMIMGYDSSAGGSYRDGAVYIPNRTIIGSFSSPFSQPEIELNGVMHMYDVTNRSAYSRMYMDSYTYILRMYNAGNTTTDVMRVTSGSRLVLYGNTASVRMYDQVTGTQSMTSGYADGLHYLQYYNGSSTFANVVTVSNVGNMNVLGSVTATNFIGKVNGFNPGLLKIGSNAFTSVTTNYNDMTTYFTTSYASYKIILLVSAVTNTTTYLTMHLTGLGGSTVYTVGPYWMNQWVADNTGNGQVAGGLTYIPLCMNATTSLAQTPVTGGNLAVQKITVDVDFIPGTLTYPEIMVSGLARSGASSGYTVVPTKKYENTGMYGPATTDVVTGFRINVVGGGAVTASYAVYAHA